MCVLLVRRQRRDGLGVDGEGYWGQQHGPGFAGIERLRICLHIE